MCRNLFNEMKCRPLLLMAFFLAGCIQHTAAADSISPSAGRTAMQPPVRAIIYFQRPTANNKQLTAAISEACNCQPIFLRAFLGEALIYEITLSQGETFSAFEKTLKQQAAELGIKSVEKDFVLQHQ
jgi:hypothetical protein